MLFIIWTFVFFSTLYLYIKKVYSRFSSQGVNHIPVVPFLGNMAGVMVKKEHMTNVLEKTYNAFPNDKMVGSYEMMTPNYVVRDLELLKKIALKDFDYFVDRGGFPKDFKDPLFGRNLLVMNGDEWKAMRSALSPAFTSSKIRLMVPFIVEVCDQMVDNLKKKIEESGDNHIDVEAKDLATRYANDVIASCTFGLKVNSVDQDNTFYSMCKETFSTFNGLNVLKIFALRSFPKIMDVLNIRLSSKAASEFFSDLVLGTMKQREDQSIIRHDMIHLLMEAKKGILSHDKEGNEESKETKDADAGFATVEESAIGKNSVNHEWTDVELVAQAVLFLFAGFEIVSTVMAFLLHELAVNPDIQERLYQEIRDHHETNNGKIDYNSIQKMTYLDMVVSETLRLWPPAPTIERVCVKDYNIGRPNEKAKKDLILRKSDKVQIHIWPIHRNPDYFPEPKKFDPERFSDENKHLIKPFTYLPFGLGPRNCIASRFALCEVKVGIYQLLLSMEITPSGKTCIPGRLDNNGLQMRIKGGHWVRMKPRTT